jgi:Flp pilus assembly protein TadD
LTSFCSRRLRVPCVLALTTFVASFAVYATTAARSLCWGDSGEFVAVAATLGVAHPPGYPLYTLLGALAVRLPFGTPFLRMSLLSALFASGAAAVAALVVWVATGRTLRKAGKGTLARAAGALFTGATLAFGPTYWSQAAVPEVYSMSAFLALSSLLLFALWSRTRGTDETRSPTDAGLLPRFLRRDGPVVLLGLVLGLALSHHLTAAFLLLPLTIGLFVGRRRPTTRAVLSATGLLVLGLSLIVYLPLRAAHNPAVLWAPIGTWRELLDHVSGAQYAPLLFVAPLVEILHKVTVFASGIPREVTWIALALAVPGFVALFRTMRVVAFALISWGVLVVGHAAVYRIPDIASYYIPIYAVLAIAGGLGLCAAASSPWWRRAAAPAGWLALAVAVAMPAMGARSNWAANNWRDRDDGKVYLARVLDAIEPGGVVVTMSDHILFPLWYARYVERTREDFSIICTREHAAHLEHWCVGVRFPTEDELCSRFENWSSSTVEPVRESIPIGNYLPLFVSMNVGERRIYADADLGRRVFPDRALRRGLVVEIVASPVNPLPAEERLEHDAFWDVVLREVGAEESPDERTAEVYATTLAAQGMLMIDRGDIESAVDALERACALAPDVPLCHSNLGVAYDKSGRREDSIAEFEVAIALNPGLAVPHHNIAVAARKSGDVERAKSELELAIALAPKNPTFRVELGGLLEENDELERAEVMFRSAASLPDDEWGASLAHGDFLSRRRRYPEAVAAYQYAQTLRPDSTGALRGLGRCYWALDDRRQALEAMRRLVELQPHNPASKYDLALMLHRSGRGREAAALLDDVIRILPNMWEARALKASILGELGRHWEARNLFEEAVGLGASGDAFWDTWIAMETVLGSEGQEAAIQERADSSSRSRGDAESGAVAE